MKNVSQVVEVELLVTELLWFECYTRERLVSVTMQVTGGFENGAQKIRLSYLALMVEIQSFRLLSVSQSFKKALLRNREVQDLSEMQIPRVRAPKSVTLFELINVLQFKL